jgi:hypothetical protein
MTALAVPDSVRKAIGDKASIDLLSWANKSFEHNLDLRLKLTESTLNSKMNSIESNLDSKLKLTEKKLELVIANKLAIETKKLDEKIFTLNTNLETKISAVKDELANKVDSHFKWLIGIMIGLWGIPVLSAVIYLVFNQFLN